MFSKYKKKKFAVEKVEIRKKSYARESKDALLSYNPLKEFVSIRTENIPYAIEILKELYPAGTLDNNVTAATLIRYEFQCECTAKQVEDSRGYYMTSNEEEDARYIYSHCLE
jgi:hypothetical protein